MNRVVYILGAGFSAPLGLPLMSGFYEKSKDMFERDPAKYSDLRHAFEEMDEIRKSGAYYATDVFNIEEILSILEMGQRIEAENKRQQFADYIKAVIEHYTPKPVPPERNWDTNWAMNIFGTWLPPIQQSWGRLWAYYGYFLGSIFNLRFEMSKTDGILRVHNGSEESSTHYSIITLNYDRVLENLCSFIDTNYRADSDLSFNTSLAQTGDFPRRPLLAKLHGSVDTDIIPPTWSKDTAVPKILEAWKLAYEALVNANYLRIIGYSLPVTDTYVRYLLKLAAIRAFNLKGIDVICKEQDNSVEANYGKFVAFRHYRFVNQDVVKYLEANFSACGSQHEKDKVGPILMDRLEDAHELFISQGSAALSLET